MNVPAPNLKNNNGAIMILFSMMLLMLVTIISIAASKTARTEVRIAGNEYRYHHNFYCAEGAVVEAIDKMEALAAIDAADHDWMMNESTEVDSDEGFIEYWADDPDTEDAVPQAAMLCNDHTEFIVIHRGVLAGSSLDMSKPTKHAFAVYGKSNNRGRVMIKVGYRKEY